MLRRAVLKTIAAVLLPLPANTRAETLWPNRPVRLLAGQPDTRWLRWGRSTEDAGRLVLVAEFDTAAAYRRAQSPLEVRPR